MRVSHCVFWRWIAAGERSVVESVDEIAAGDVLEVQGAPLAPAPGAISDSPRFAAHGASSSQTAETHARDAAWRQAVTEVLQRQRDPDAAHRLLAFMHEAAVAAKRSAAVLAKRGTIPGVPSPPPAAVVSAEPGTAESLRRCPQALAFLHRLGFRAHARTRPTDEVAPAASPGSRLATAMSGLGGASFALQPGSAVDLADASAAVAEVMDGKTGLERLLAMASAMGGATATAGAASSTADAPVVSASGGSAARPFSPAAIAAAQTAGGADLSRARAEVAAMAVSLGGAEAAAPAARNAVVLPTPRTRLPEAAARSDGGGASSAPAAAVRGSAEGSEDDISDSDEAGRSSAGEEDTALPRSAAEWRAAELAHAHRMELARGGADALRAKRLRATLSAEAAASTPDKATATSCPGGQRLRLRLVFPDSVTVVADFGPLEPSSALAALASRCLASAEQAEGLTVQSLRPEGGTWTLRGDTPLVLAGVRSRATLTVRTAEKRPVYTSSVQAAVDAGGAAVALE